MQLLWKTVGEISEGQLLVDTDCHSATLGVSSQDVHIVVACCALHLSASFLEADQVRLFLPDSLERPLFEGGDIPLQQLDSHSVLLFFIVVIIIRLYYIIGIYRIYIILLMNYIGLYRRGEVRFLFRTQTTLLIIL